MSTSSTNEQVTRLLLSHRKSLFAYIYAILRDPHRAEDVFQDVSVVLIQNWERFGEVRDFWALARETARRQCLADFRKKGRLPVALSPEALDAVDRGFDEVKDCADDRREALTSCLEKLPEKWRTIVHSRYWTGKSVTDIASSLKSTQNSISVTLNRIRSKLADCVTSRLGVEGAP